MFRKTDWTNVRVLSFQREDEASRWLAALKLFLPPGFGSNPSRAERAQPHIPLMPRITLLGAYLFRIYLNRVMS